MENTGNGKDKLSYTTTTLITTTDKHGVPPTKRLFRVAMLDPSQGFIDPWGNKGIKYLSSDFIQVTLSIREKRRRNNRIGKKWEKDPYNISEKFTSGYEILLQDGMGG
ncbi:hypothetical protein Tco_0531120 [Tanacetum coccineum]